MLMLKSNGGKTGTVLIEQKQEQKGAQKTRVKKSQPRKRKAPYTEGTMAGSP